MKLYEVLYQCEECYIVEGALDLYDELSAQLEDLVDQVEEARFNGDDQLADELAAEIDEIEQQMEEIEDTYFNESLNEAAIRQYKRIGQTVRKRYRCTSGPKKGKLVSEPGKCAQRKDPKKVRQGRKVMRSKKGVIGRKARISKRKQISRMVARMNKRLAGK